MKLGKQRPKQWLEAQKAKVASHMMRAGGPQKVGFPEPVAPAPSRAVPAAQAATVWRKRPGCPVRPQDDEDWPPIRGTVPGSDLPKALN